MFPLTNYYAATNTEKDRRIMKIAFLPFKVLNIEFHREVNTSLLEFQITHKHNNVVNKNIIKTLYNQII